MTARSRSKPSSSIELIRDTVSRVETAIDGLASGDVNYAAQVLDDLAVDLIGELNAAAEAPGPTELRVAARAGLEERAA